MEQWKNFWLSPAIMAAIIMIIFGLLFWDRTRTAPVENGEGFDNLPEPDDTAKGDARA